MSPAWPVDRWQTLESQILRRTRSASSSPDCLHHIRRGSRTVLRSFSGSFFLVTRFLPEPKRALVELIYAAVRYPDEIVDTFPLPSETRLRMLAEWQQHYELALTLPGVPARLKAGIPWILAGFAQVVHDAAIPARHYRSFLDAMRRDVTPCPFATLADLIENYIYGSAIVVGYFLAHVYGPAPGCTLTQTCSSAAALGIALQLTNFARDVQEDAARGRSYIPADMASPIQLALEAERNYSIAESTLSAFAPDTQPAIRACIDVYRLLNQRILAAGPAAPIRHSVPAAQKFAALPAGKYWRVPLAYLGAL